MKLITELFLLSAVGTSSVMAAEMAATADPVSHYASIVEKYGVTLCILIYFVIRDYLSRKTDAAEKAAMASKVNELECFIRDKFSEKLDDAVEIMKENKKMNKALVAALETKAPCLQVAKVKAALHKEDTADL